MGRWRERFELDLGRRWLYAGTDYVVLFSILEDYVVVVLLLLCCESLDGQVAHSICVASLGIGFYMLVWFILFIYSVYYMV